MFKFWDNIDTSSHNYSCLQKCAAFLRNEMPYRFRPGYRYPMAIKVQE